MDLVRGVGGVVSTVLALACTIPYWRSILNGATKPHQFSWLVFTIMGGIVTISQLLEGGRSSVLISATFFVASFVNFLLSFRYGVRDSSRADRVLLALSLATIVVWLFTKDNVLAIWLTVAIDVFASTMIILKVRSDPHSEDYVPWLIGTVAYVFSCMTLLGTSPNALYIRPIYGLATDLIIVAAILYLKGPAADRTPVQDAPKI